MHHASEVAFNSGLSAKLSVNISPEAIVSKDKCIEIARAEFVKI